MGTFKSVVSSSIFLLCSIASFAEANDALIEADELLLFEDMDVVVSASRLEQPIDQLSVPVSILSKEDLHYGGFTSISEALRYAPGVDVLQLDRSRYAVGIHGLQGLFSDRLMTLIDGMPADSPAFGGPEFESLPITIEDIERIEVVRGSGGASWGANALSGVVNIITKKPSDVEGVFASASVSGFGDSFSQIRYGDSNGNWSWLLSAAYEDVKSSADALGEKPHITDDYMHRMLARTAWVYATETDLKVSFGGGITGTERGGFETSNLEPTNANELNSANGYLLAEKKFNNDVEGYFRWVGRYQDMERPSYGDVRYKVRENDFEGQVTLSGIENHSIALGGNFRCSRLSSRAYNYDIFTLVDDDIYERWAGIFGLDRYQFSRQFSLESQLRLDYFSEGDADWSGRFSGIYGVAQEMRHVVRLSAAKSYRQPVGFIRNAIYDSRPGTLPFEQHYRIDPDMNPEDAWSLEAGYSWSISQQLKLKADLYYMWYRDLIGAVGDFRMTAMGVPAVFIDVTNTGDADGYGGEIELEYRTETLLVRAWYGRNEFETEYPNQSIRAFLPANNKVGLMARWAVNPEWTLTGQYVYTEGVREDIADESLASTCHMDFTVARSFLEKKGEIMLGVNDLFTKEYEPHVGLSQTGGNKIPGRTFFARFQYTF